MRYLGGKKSSGSSVSCTVPAVDDVYTVDPVDPTKGVWKKAGTDNIANSAINATKVAPKALTNDHLTNDIVQGHGLLNKFFGASNSAVTAPAGFFMVGGAVFGTDVYKNTTTHRAGAHALTFRANCPTSYGFETDLIPVREGEFVEGIYGFQASGTTVAAAAVLAFFQFDKTTQVGGDADIYRGAAGAASTKYTKRVAGPVPANARFVKARVTITVQHATETLTVDTLNIVSTPFGGFTGIMPIGSIVAWDKSLPGVPALPAGWVECNGQVLPDKDSVLDGQTIPNLNGASAQPKRFLRGGATSGGMSNSNIAPHTHTMDHGHTLDRDAGGVGIYTNVSLTSNNNNTAVAGVVNDFAGPTGSTGYDDTYPAHMTVVWIMRVK